MERDMINYLDNHDSAYVPIKNETSLIKIHKLLIKLS